MNLPNKITLLRIVLIPLFMVLLLTEINVPLIWKYNYVIAAIVFCFAAITDTVDGYIARQRKQVTTFGKLMDPIADKLLISAAVLCLVQLDRLSAWVATVIISRDLAVSGLRSVAAAKNVIISASWWGKAKTISQIVAITLAILNIQLFVVGVRVEDIFMFLAVVITIISGVDYFAKAWSLVSNSDQTEGSGK